MAKHSRRNGTNRKTRNRVTWKGVMYPMRKTNNLLPASIAVIITGLVLSLALISCAQSNLADRFRQAVTTCESGKPYGSCENGGTLFCNAAGSLQCVGGTATGTGTSTSTGISSNLPPNNTNGTRMTVPPGNPTINVQPGLEQLPQPVTGTVTYGGLTFSLDWIGHPHPQDPSQFCVNPARETVPGEDPRVKGWRPLAPEFYDNGPYTSAASPFLGYSMPTPYGTCFSMRGQPSGNYHVNMITEPVSTPDRGPMCYWLQYGEVPKHMARGSAECSWVEQGLYADGTERNSVGLTFTWNNVTNTISVAPTGGTACM